MQDTLKNAEISDLSLSNERIWKSPSEKKLWKDFQADGLKRQGKPADNPVQ
jgi:hypothetical protein